MEDQGSDQQAAQPSGQHAVASILETFQTQEDQESSQLAHGGGYLGDIVGGQHSQPPGLTVASILQTQETQEQDGWQSEAALQGAPTTTHQQAEPEHQHAILGPTQDEDAGLLAALEIGSEPVAEMARQPIQATQDTDARLLAALEIGSEPAAAAAMQPSEGTDTRLLAELEIGSEPAGRPVGQSLHASEATDARLLAALEIGSEPANHTAPQPMPASQATDAELLAQLELGSEPQVPLDVGSAPHAAHAAHAPPQRHQTGGNRGGYDDIDEDLMQDAFDYETELQEYRAHSDTDAMHDYMPGMEDEVAPLRPGHGAQPTRAAAQPAGQPHLPATATGRAAAAGPAPARPAAATAAGATMPQPLHPGAANVTANTNPTVEARIDELFEAASDDGDVDNGCMGYGRPPRNQPPCLLACEIDGDCIPVTCASGVRVYCAMGPPPAQALPNPAGVQAPGTRRGVNLLSRPISEMLHAVNEARTEAAIEESHRTAAALAQAQAAEAAAIAAAGHDANGLQSPPAHLPGRADGGGLLSPAARQSGRLAAAMAGAGGGLQSPVVRSGGAGGEGKGEDRLWVSKYAPRKFMSLLSDEQTNRQVAQWVKAWDPCVFGRPAGPATAVAQQAAAQAGGRGWGAGRGSFGGRGAYMGGRGGPAASGLGGGEADTRPEKKVILLCGPPGLGKTTLAHVVAAHCGYHPYEINASDDRTAAKLTERVNDAVQMKPVLGERKPNCVIIDEIDGATGGAEGHGAIAALLAIVNAGSGGKAGAEEADGKAGGKAGGKVQKKGGRRGRGPRPLMRPIICIANDLYAPALRPLRDVAQIFHFKAPDVEKLVSRLAIICEQEGVSADRAALFALAERSDCDIRTCLNTLQFLAKQAGGGLRASPPPAGVPRAAGPGTGAGGLTSPQSGSHSRRAGSMSRSARITLHQVEKLGVGSKDTRRSMFGVWEAMLQLPRHVPGAQGAGPGTRARGGRVQELYSLLQDHGEYELIMSGLHDNLLSVRYLDVHLKNTSIMMDALMDADMLLQSCRRRGEYLMLSYVPARLLQLHVLAAQPEKPHLQWPKAQSDASRRGQAHQEILRNWAGYRVAGRVLQAHPANTLAMEVVPALLRLLSPSLRPLAPNVLSPVERAAMASTVSIMCDFGVRYSMEDEDVKPGWKPNQSPGLAGVLTPRPVPLDPPLDRMHAFTLARTTARMLPGGVMPLKPVPAVLRQMLNQQATLEGIRRAEAVKSSGVDIAAEGPGSQAEETPPLAGPGAGPGVGGRSGGGGFFKAPTNPPQPAVRPLQPADPNAGKAMPPPPPKPAAKSKPLNWLDTHRLNATNKRKAQSAASRQQSKRQATEEDGTEGGAEGAADSSPSKHQFPVLYRYKEGYTNAVKRPLLIKELL